MKQKTKENLLGAAIFLIGVGLPILISAIF
jgi:hypothetical protein